MTVNLEQLTQAVQKNCHISDAQHAADYTLCIYLLKMREYYRWEKNLGFSQALPHDDIGDWLTGREQLWDELQGQDYVPVETGNNSHEPFKSDAINEEILEQGLVYSAGFGPKSKPLFFLGELEQKINRDEYTILVSAREYARDLTAPPAMTQGNTIFIRRESLRRMVWEKIEEWGWHQNKNAMFNAMNQFDFVNEPDAALDQMTDKELNTVLLHEIGEIMANRLLGDKWKTMLASLPRSHAEIMARAVKDHLADTLSTLPDLIEANDETSLHFYFANFSHMRKEIAPSMCDAYQSWCDTGDMDQLKNITKTGLHHWQKVAEDILTLHQQHGPDATTAIEDLVKQNPL